VKCIVSKQIVAVNSNIMTGNNCHVTEIAHRD